MRRFESCFCSYCSFYFLYPLLLVPILSWSFSFHHCGLYKRTGKLLYNNNRGPATSNSFQLSSLCVKAHVVLNATQQLVPASGASESFRGSILGALWERKRGVEGLLARRTRRLRLPSMCGEVLWHIKELLSVAALARRVPAARLQAQSRITSHQPLVSTGNDFWDPVYCGCLSLNHGDGAGVWTLLISPWSESLTWNYWHQARQQGEIRCKNPKGSNCRTL